MTAPFASPQPRHVGCGLACAPLCAPVALAAIALLLLSQASFGAEAVFRLGGPQADVGKDVAVDAAGNIYLAGSFTGAVDFDPADGVASRTAAGETDVFLARYDREGRFLGVTAFGGPGADAPHRIAIDADANVCVVGFFSDTVDFDPSDPPSVRDTRTSVGGRDAFLAKYAPDGRLLWVHAFGDEDWVEEFVDGRRVPSSRRVPDPNRFEEALDLAVDRDGNVTIVGCFNGRIALNPALPREFNASTDRSTDIFVASFTPDGRYRWGGTTGGPGRDTANAVAVDARGNVYLTGAFTREFAFLPGVPATRLRSRGASDIFLARFARDGAFSWVVSMGGLGNDQVRPGGMAVSDYGIYLTGEFSETADMDPGEAHATLLSAGETDIFLARYDLAGNHLWSVGFGGPLRDAGQRVAVDPNGNAWVTGWFREAVDFDPGAASRVLKADSTGGGADAFLAMFSHDGKLRWVRSAGAPLSGQHNQTLGLALAVDASGGVVWAGLFNATVTLAAGPSRHTLTSAGGADVFVARFTADGILSGEVEHFERGAGAPEKP